MQSLGEPAEVVGAVARVAVNLRGIPRDALGRGDALLTPRRFLTTDVLDVRVHGDPAADLSREALLHIGSAAVPVRIRPLGVDTARLTLAAPLPLRIGDRALLRDPGRHHVFGGMSVLDVRPPRWSAAAPPAPGPGCSPGWTGAPTPPASCPAPGRAPRRPGGDGRAHHGRAHCGDWLVDPTYLAELRQRLGSLVTTYAAEHPLEGGVPIEVARHRLDLPDRALAEALVSAPLALREGRIVSTGDRPELPPALAQAVRALEHDLADAPFAAPEAGRLAQLGLGSRELAAAVRAGALMRVADAVVLLPGAEQAAATSWRRSRNRSPSARRARRWAPPGG